jgi:hypothetical protein
MREQRQMFRAKFGRDPGPNDPVFFDSDSDEPRPIELDSIQREVVAIMRKARISPELIYAYSRTGLIVTDENYSLISPEDRDAWKRAIVEYFEFDKHGVI